MDIGNQLQKEKSGILIISKIKKNKMAKKVSKTQFKAASNVVAAYVKQEGKIAAKKAHKHGKAAAKTIAAKSTQAFNFIKNKLK